MNIGTKTSICVPTVRPLAFGERMQFTLNTCNGKFKVIQQYSLTGSYTGTILKDMTLTIGASVNRNI